MTISSFNKTAPKSEIFDEKSKNSYEDLFMFKEVLLKIFKKDTTNIGRALEIFYDELVKYKGHLTTEPPITGLQRSIKLDLEILFEDIYKKIKWPRNPLTEQDEKLKETRQQFLRLIRNISIKFNLNLASITNMRSQLTEIEDQSLYNFLESNLWYRYAYKNNTLILTKKDVLITNLIIAYQTAKENEKKIIVDTAEAFDVDIDFIGSLADSLHKSDSLTDSFITTYFPIILMGVLFEMMPKESRKLILDYIGSVTINSLYPKEEKVSSILSSRPALFSNPNKLQFEEEDDDGYEKLINDHIQKFCKDNKLETIFNEWKKEMIVKDRTVQLNDIVDLFKCLEEATFQHKRTGVAKLFTLSFNSIRSTGTFSRLESFRKSFMIAGFKDAYEKRGKR